MRANREREREREGGREGGREEIESERRRGGSERERGRKRETRELRAHS